MEKTYKEYLEDQYSDVLEFIREKCEVDETGKNKLFIVLEELAEAFRKYTGSTKKGTKSIIRDIFESTEFIERGIVRIDRRGSKVQVRVLKNIKLKD